MRERAVKIGKPTALAAVIAEPDEVRPEQPAIIILNSGVMHHVGTCRISVLIARALAEAGYLSVRFDFSGIGDSETRRGDKPFEQTALEESTEVMDYLQRRRKVSKFILYGLCSGADGSFEVAKVDDRVVGLIQIDAFCYKTPAWYLVHYGSKIASASAWRTLFKRLFSRRAGAQVDALDAAAEEDFVELPSYVREFPPRQVVAEGLKKICAKGVHIYNFFTGEAKEINHQQQYRKSFSDVDFANLLKVDYLPSATHIVTGKDDQKFIVDAIRNWVSDISSRLTSTVDQASSGTGP